MSDGSSVVLQGNVVSYVHLFHISSSVEPTPHFPAKHVPFAAVLSVVNHMSSSGRSILEALKKKITSFLEEYFNVCMLDEAL